MPKGILVNASKELINNPVFNTVKSAIEPKDLEKEGIITVNNTNNLQFSYVTRTKAMARAARRVCKVLKSTENSNKLLDEKIDFFEKYIEKLENDYIQKQKQNITIKEHQKIHMEYLQHLEFALADQILPLAKDKFPNVDKKAKKIAGKLLAKADEYEVLESPRPILATIVQSGVQPGGGFIVQQEVPLSPISEKMAEEFLNAKPDKKNQPAWYIAMPGEEKIFFDDMMKDVNSIGAVYKKMPVISSRLRTIPGVANFSRHEVAMLNHKGEFMEQPPGRYRSSMVASRNMLKLNEDDRVKIAVANIEKIIEEFLKKKFPGRELDDLSLDEIQNIPILIQTLISPLKVGLITKQPDLSLFQDKQRAIEFINTNGCNIAGKKINFKYIISTNHPLNPARHIVGTGTILEYEPNINRDSIKNIIELAGKLNDPVVTQAATDLDNLSALKIRGLDNNQRELHLAALEEFIVVRLGGLSYGSCVSGKDRKGIETIYMDAMEAYFQKYEKLPKYNESDPTDRANFVDIYVDLYTSYHQQFNSGQNAPGAEGIKTADLYLPADIQQAIIKKTNNPDIFKESSRLGDNNDSDKVLKKAKKELTPEQKDECRKAFIVPQAAVQKEPTPLIPTDTYERTIQALTQLKDHISSEGKFSKSSSKLMSALDQRIRLLEAIPHLKMVKDQFEHYEKALEHIHPEFSSVLKNVKAMDGLTGNNVLEQFEKLSHTAVEQLKVQNKLMATPANTETSEPIKIVRREGETEEAAIQRIVMEKTGASFVPSPSGSHSTLLSGHAGTSTQMIRHDEVRPCKIIPQKDTDKVIVYAETAKDGVGKSTIYQLPDDLLPEKIWGKIRNPDIFTNESEFIALFKKIMEQQGVYGKDTDLKKNIRIEMRKLGCTDDRIADGLFKQYKEEYEKTLYSNRDNKGSPLPCNDLIKLAKGQVEGLKEIKPNDPIVITRGPSEAYVKTVMLYALAQDYEVQNHSNFRGVAIPSSKEVERFRAFLGENQATFGYHDRRVASRIAQQVASDQQKYFSPRGSVK